MSLASVADQYLVWLDRAPAPRSVVGGKAASLSQLLHLGAPVPPAFALTIDAYRDFAHAIGVPTRGDVPMHQLPELHTRILEVPLPPAIKATIVRGWAGFQERLGPDVPLAVRSSAASEDAVDRSFAGQHDSFLSVRSLPVLEGAVRRCWASLWSERAMSYRLEQLGADDVPGIAVVVQQMIPADVSFVAFTSDPLEQHNGHVVVSATWGLGEALVAGLVVPDHVVVGPDGEITSYTVGDKQLMVIPASDGREGVQEVPVPRVLRAAPALTTEQAAEIATTARHLATRLGYEADLEGVIAGGRMYVVQSRPITTISPRVSGAQVALTA